MGSSPNLSIYLRGIMWFFKNKPEKDFNDDIMCLRKEREDLKKEIQLLKDKISNLEYTVKDLKIQLWICNTVSSQIQYKAMERNPNSWMSDYDNKCRELEKNGWYIKRVSDCGKYEIWVPREEKMKFSIGN